MARLARLTAQLPPSKATPEQRACLDREADERHVDLAQIIREMVDARYGLSDGERPAGGADQGAPAR